MVRCLPIACSKYIFDTKVRNHDDVQIYILPSYLFCFIFFSYGIKEMNKMDLNNKLLRNAEASFKSHLDGGECDHLVAYSMACTIENEDEHELKHEVIRFGSLDEVLMMMI